MTPVAMNDMRVLMASTSYPADEWDWRGRFIADMASAVSKKGICLSLWSPPGKLPQGAINVVSENDSMWLSRMSEEGGIAHLLRTRLFRGLNKAFGLLRRLRLAYSTTDVDVIHINWLQNALPLGRTETPALVTVLGSDFRMLKLPGMVYLLRRVFANRHVMIAPNALWMVPTLQEYFGDIAEVRPIPFGVDARWFGIRRQQGIPPKWIVVSRITTDKIGDLLTWGAGLFGHGRELHLFGPMQEKLRLPDWVIWHGPTHPNELAEKWFPYATGLITLSKHSEGRPQVLLEAMAAGLPAVVSNLPAHTDVVIHGKTGWIADSPASLIQALQQAEDKDMNLQIGESARSYIQESIGDWDSCAERYVAAYHDLLARKHGA